VSQEFNLILQQPPHQRNIGVSFKRKQEKGRKEVKSRGTGSGLAPISPPHPQATKNNGWF
jgi:hypothetical protein